MPAAAAPLLSLRRRLILSLQCSLSKSKPHSCTSTVASPISFSLTFSANQPAQAHRRCPDRSEKPKKNQAPTIELSDATQHSAARTSYARTYLHASSAAVGPASVARGAPNFSGSGQTPLRLFTLSFSARRGTNPGRPDRCGSNARLHTRLALLAMHMHIPRRMRPSC